jgi:capsular exopolysaccharide synthesis family protein
MSEIYAALKRAETEQKAAQPLGLSTAAEVLVSAAVDGLSPVPTEIALDDIAVHAWSPNVEKLPTLGGRGANVEQFRTLRSRINQICDKEPLKSILISSGMPQEGKSFVAANLAISLARHQNRKILLIDGDLRRPSLHTLLGCQPKPGLAEYLAGKEELSQIMQRGGITNLTFIPASSSGDNAAELAGNHKIEGLIATLAPLFDWIIVDSSPVIPVSDAVNFARACDAVLLVARSDTTPFDIAQRANAEFRNSRVLGFVLNGARNVVGRGGYYQYSGYDTAQPQSEVTKG